MSDPIFRRFKNPRLCYFKYDMVTGAVFKDDEQLDWVRRSVDGEIEEVATSRDVENRLVVFSSSDVEDMLRPDGNEAKDDSVDGEFIIGRLEARGTGRYKLAEFTKTFKMISLKEAMSEAEKLARDHPTSKFTVFQVHGTVQAGPTKWEQK